MADVLRFTITQVWLFDTWSSSVGDDELANNTWRASHGTFTVLKLYRDVLFCVPPASTHCDGNGCSSPTSPAYACKERTLLGGGAEYHSYVGI